MAAVLDIIVLSVDRPPRTRTNPDDAAGRLGWYAYTWHANTEPDDAAPSPARPPGTPPSSVVEAVDRAPIGAPVRPRAFGVRAVPNRQIPHP